MSKFKIGQKVICIETDWVSDVHPESLFTPSPSFGELCVVDEIFFDEEGYAIGIVGYESDCFGENSFRPVAYPTQDIAHDLSIFSPLLTLERT